MFDPDEFAAMMDDRLERHCPSATEESAAMVERICAARVSRIGLRRRSWVAVGELFLSVVAVFGD